MKHKVWYDERIRTLRLELVETFTRKDGPGFTPLVENSCQGKEHRYILTDLSDDKSTNGMDKEARRGIKEYAQSLRFDKVAIFGAKPAMRMLARIVLTATGKSKQVSFFTSVDEVISRLEAISRLEGKSLIRSNGDK